MAPSGRARWSTSAAVVPGVMAALLPRVTCPACWPAYAGFLGAAGLPILMDVRWLLPLTGASLVVAVGALAYGARSRRGYAPLLVGLAAAAFVLIGKFVMNSNPATYLGTALLVMATVWNAWPPSRNVERREGAAQVTR
jgi:mercuric ion transport protein